VPSAETALELAARRLQGEVLARVDYLDAWPGRDRGVVADRDAVELAVYLTMASGACFEVRWADTLGSHHGFGIDVREVRVRDGDRGKLVDATARWADLRGSFAIGIAIHSDYLRRPDYPRALVVELDDARTVVVETRFENALTVRLG
jgi:hypothetical protein